MWQKCKTENIEIDNRELINRDKETGREKEKLIQGALVKFCSV